MKEIKAELASKLDSLKEELASGQEEKTRLLEENQYMQENAVTPKDLQSKDELITKLKIDACAAVHGERGVGPGQDEF